MIVEQYLVVQIGMMTKFYHNIFELYGTTVPIKKFWLSGARVSKTQYHQMWYMKDVDAGCKTSIH